MNVTDTLVLSLFTVAIVLYIWWGARVLPGEKWQFFFTMPVSKDSDGRWSGVNFTWYGVLTANAYIVSIAVLLVLAGSAGIPVSAVAILVLVMLGFCVPASRIVARVVEKKAHTFTVGGAVFVGIIIAPLVIMLVNRLVGAKAGFHINIMVAWAAIAIAYAFGEGLGRLACISFGCCYGKPVARGAGLLADVFSGRGLKFYGSTKKIAYAGGLEAVEVIPVQVVTAVVCTVCGLVSSVLFLSSRYTASFLVAVITTQIWRFFSESMRADYRGEGRLSAYQIMCLLGIFYSVIMALVTGMSESGQTAELAAGLKMLWNPVMIIFLQAIWFLIFVYTGRSTVTGAHLSFHIHQERV